MENNFKKLESRVIDSLNKTDLEFIRYELSKINTPTITTGVGGSNVVSSFTSKVLNTKNNIISISKQPRDIKYENLNGFKNLICCSYSGNNFGVDLSFDNNLKHYLLSKNAFDDKNTTYLKYEMEPERSFISLAATLVPISIVLNYYLNGYNKDILKNLKEYKFNFDTSCNCFEIFSGYDTSVTSTYLESTMMESGLGIPIVHDKYDYCHGRSTISINYNNIAIYLNKNTELDKLLLKELKKYYKDIIVLESNYKDDILDDYKMLIEAMYLTKYIGEQKNKDLSIVEHSPITKILYKYKGQV